MDKNTIMVGKEGILALFIFFILILSCNNISAKENPKIELITLNSYKEGDILSFNYNISSEVSTSFNLSEGVICQDFSVPSKVETIEVRANIVFNGYYDMGFVVGEGTAQQSCTAFVEVISDIPVRIEKNLFINPTPLSKFSIQICEDMECTQKTTVFTRWDAIFLDFLSEVVHPSITATLTYPDKSTKQITLPTSIAPEQIGTYTLEATASKEGYKTITKKEQFAVIEKHAEIRDALGDASECNADGVCSNKENSQNCPSDCPSVKGRPEKKPPLKEQSTKELSSKKADSSASQEEKPESKEKPKSKEKSKSGWGLTMLAIIIASAIMAVLAAAVLIEILIRKKRRN